MNKILVCRYPIKTRLTWRYNLTLNIFKIITSCKTELPEARKFITLSMRVDYKRSSDFNHVHTC